MAEPVAENSPAVALTKEEKKEEEVVVTNPELEKGPTSARTAFRTVARNPRTLAPSGTYYFTASAGIKSEPKLSSPDLAKYSAGQSVNYDRLLTAENHQWISYISYSGHRRYIAVKELPKPVAATPTAPVAPVSQPTTPVSSQPTTPVSESGVHTFTKKSGVKSEPKLSSPDLAYYNTGDMVKYDSKLESEGHQWISYVNYNGGRSYIEIGKLTESATPVTNPVTKPKPVSQPVATPATPETVSTIPSSGVYTFTERVSIKAEPKVSSPELAFYNAGDKVRYDSTVVADGHNWISYVSYAGGRSYIAVGPSGASSSTTTTTPAPAQPAPVAQPVSASYTSPNARPAYQANTYPYGQCTWGAKELANWVNNYWGDAGWSWISNAKSQGFNVGDTPKVGSVAVWNGHVAVVTEVVHNNLIRVKESNFNYKQYIDDHRGLFNPNITSNGSVIGYIYPPGR